MIKCLRETATIPASTSPSASEPVTASQCARAVGERNFQFWLNPAAEAIGGGAAESIKSKLQKKRYYIVVESIHPEQRNKAIQRAETLKEKGYDTEIHYSTTGYLAVTVGHLPMSEAKSLLAKAVAQNDGPHDSYLHSGDTFTERVYPGK